MMKDSRKGWWTNYLSKLRSKREFRRDAHRITALSISSPRSNSDEFHSLGPMSPVSPEDFVRTESYFNVAKDQGDDCYKYSASIYEEDIKSSTESLGLRPSPTSDEFSNDFMVGFFLPSSSVTCFIVTALLTRQRWLPADGILGRTRSAVMNGSFLRCHPHFRPRSCRWMTWTQCSCQSTLAPS